MDSAQLDMIDKHLAKQETAYTWHFDGSETWYLYPSWERELDEGVFDNE